MSRATKHEIEQYYQSFSYEAGMGDWVVPNPRHQQLKLLVDDVLKGQDGLRILDIGCGAGVMSAHLTRYGIVTGIDFSAPAIDMARRMVPAGRFETSRVEELPGGERYDVITMFDVLEHIVEEERHAFLANVAARLTENGVVIASTPHPAHTRWAREAAPESLQIVDEEVEVTDVLAVARELGLSLLRYTAYDVDRACQYQFLALRAADDAGGPPRQTPGLRRRMLAVSNPASRLARRGYLGVRAKSRGEDELARRLLRPGALAGGADPRAGRDGA
jgi:2-polyprenyl-3-methyl-5-hydroxy-6-metoxy-1,4-benzoquinol methylase